ncbi:MULTISPECIES: flagellar motor protein MotB [Paenibacillus]|uniref:flagellar motor protein MotB n=1 Tax=Paenibacillus TaxID=44249 RepID=UPI0003E1F3CF|nr:MULTISPECIES: flagellar motor protein MotB [Paenibacillus]ETT65570.1 OmpA/MotB domain-containing protein [Paenibacillus sp. FSL H8-237]MEC0133093.1 flagellar motor protein MotB [Paenibacillus odorifer]MEC0223528.1 flagellar motor protein MotB [Paenibacillus odorifer]OMD12222.1 flagellar motor protein [Paenibacillus odorifer]OME28156.1 flagellar motor protein [Paenibacillus odorifer]
MRQRDRRKRRVENRESRDRWMITYADLITLLLIFFVILYAMSSLDTDKYNIVTGSLSQTFKSSSTVLEGGDGILDAGKTPDNKPESTDGNGNATAKPNDGSDKQTENETPSARELAFREQEAKLAELMGVITHYVEENNLGEQIFVADKPQGIEITLSDRFLFDVGKADVKSPALPALQQLSGLFKDIGATISIEGHTDNTPVSSASRYNDNWELSGARALSVLRFFLDNEGLNPDTFQYAGYADTRPTADNTTVAGKQKNRRVEIIVLRQLQEVE